MHKIERRIRERFYASPSRALIAIGKSQLPRKEAARLRELVGVWQAESGQAASAVPPVIAGELAVGTPRGENGGGIVRFETVRHAHGVLLELARDKHADLLQLLSDVQSYELSVRREVLRRADQDDRQGSVEEPS